MPADVALDSTPRRKSSDRVSCSLKSTQRVSAIDYLIDSIEAALREDSRTVLYDSPFLKFLTRLEGIFDHGVTNVEFLRADDPPTPMLQIQQPSVGQ